MRASPLPWLALLSLAGCFLFSRADPPVPAPPPAEAPEALQPAEPEPTSPPAPPPAPAPLVLRITLHASDRLNPDERGSALPTAVVIYQLKSAAKLDAADFDDVYRRARDVLGEDLLHADELELAPGQVQTRTLDREKGARALAVVALVRRPSGPGWRSIVELPPADQSATLSFVFDGYRVDRE